MIPAFFGVGAIPAYRQFLLDSKANKLQGRHLGAIHVYSGSNGAEVQSRIDAMWRAYAHMGKFWRGCKYFRMKKLIFHSNITGSSLSGLEPFVMSRTEHDRLTTALVKIARRVLGSRATSYRQEEGETKWRSLPNHDVRRMLNILPHHTEMLLRRLQYYQRMIRQQDAHTQVLAALFSPLEFEQEDPVDIEGRIRLGVAHPWLLQLQQDFDTVFAKIEDLFLDGSVLDGRYAQLFWPHGEGSELLATVEHFRDFDIHATRPIFLAQSFDDLQPTLETTHVSFPCPIKINEHTCGLTFKSHMALLSHIRLSHGARNLLDLLTCTNQCVFCRSCFTNRENARVHTQRAVRSHLCRINRSIVSSPVVPRDLTCTLCGEDCTSLAELQDHLLSHWHLPIPKVQDGPRPRRDRLSRQEEAEGEGGQQRGRAGTRASSSRRWGRGRGRRQEESRQEQGQGRRRSSPQLLQQRAFQDGGGSEQASPVTRRQHWTFGVLSDHHVHPSIRIEIDGSGQGRGSPILQESSPVRQRDTEQAGATACLHSHSDSEVPPRHGQSGDIHQKQRPTAATQGVHPGAPACRDGRRNSHRAVLPPQQNFQRRVESSVSLPAASARGVSQLVFPARGWGRASGKGAERALGTPMSAASDSMIGTEEAEAAPLFRPTMMNLEPAQPRAVITRPLAPQLPQFHAVPPPLSCQDTQSVAAPAPPPSSHDSQSSAVPNPGHDSPSVPDLQSNTPLNPGHASPVPDPQFYAMDSPSGHDHPSVPGHQSYDIFSSQGSTPVAVSQIQTEEEISSEVPEDAPVTVTQEIRERLSLIAEFIQAARE